MNSGKKKVADHYDRVASVFDQQYDTSQGRVYHHHISQHMLELIPKGRFLLDLGCGTGLFMRRYAESGGMATGIDISSEMIAVARKNAPQFEYVVGTAEELPFGDATFDVVSCVLVFTYLENPRQMLKESRRVLKPGGCLVVCAISKSIITSLIPTIYRIEEKMKIAKNVVVGDLGENYYNEKEMVDLFTDCGFTNIKTKRCSFAHYSLPKTLFNITRDIESFIEKKISRLAYNLVICGQVPNS